MKEKKKLLKIKNVMKVKKNHKRRKMDRGQLKKKQERNERKSD